MRAYELIEHLKDKIIDIKKSENKNSLYRVKAYENVIKKISALYDTNRKIKKDDIADIDLTSNMKTKLIDIILNGKIRPVLEGDNSVIKPSNKKEKIERKESKKRRINSRSKSRTRYDDEYNTDDEERDKHKLKKKLVKYMGVGEVKANQLIDEGLMSIDDLRKKKWQSKLSDETKLFIKLDPSDKIPHNDIVKIEKHMKKIEPKMIFVGSYRRNMPFSSDIDIMIVGDSDNLINEVINKLNAVYKMYVYSKGDAKSSFIVDFSKTLKSLDKMYKVDIFVCKTENYIPMLLYSTGSQGFNIYMRGIAKKKGYLLNQKGLFDKKTGEKIPNLKTEKDYFDILGMEWLEPNERV